MIFEIVTNKQIHNYKHVKWMFGLLFVTHVPKMIYERIQHRVVIKIKI